MQTDQDIITPERKPLVTPTGETWHHCSNCDRRWPCDRVLCTCGIGAAYIETTACSQCTFSLECQSCDAGTGIPSIEAAHAEGWTDLQPDDFGLAWTWLGLCPDCKQEGEPNVDGQEVLF